MAIHRLILLDALRRIRNNGPLFPQYGICANVAKLTQYDQGADRALQQLIQQWPRKQASPNYPVEGSSFAYNMSPDKWEDTRRIALLNWLIDTLETEARQA